MSAYEWEILQWRRLTLDLYRAVRHAPTPRDGHALWVAGRDDMLANHPATPIPPERRLGFRADVAPYDPDLRFVVPVDVSVAAQRREVPTASDGVVPFERVGRVELPGLGELDVWWLDSYGGGMFIPLRDGSSGSVTYGGGRYLIDTVKGADLGGDTSGLVVDLNFACQPSCAYSSEWVCPLPGPGNTLSVSADVGERYIDLSQ